MPTFDPGVLRGFLATEPGEGDALVIGRLDQPLQATDVTYTRPGGGVA